MADWMHPRPSSQSLFSSMLGDNIDSMTVSESTYEGESGFSFHGSQEHHASTNPNYRDGPQAHTTIDQTTTSWAMSAEQQISTHGGLLERMAARAGFNAPRLNTETFKQADLSRDWEVRPPYLTIPSGLSPTTLLESPAFFSNSLYSKTFDVDGLSESADTSKENFFGIMDASSFAFRPVSESGPSQFFGSSDRASFSSIEVSVHSENTFPPQTSEHPKATILNQQTDSFRLSKITDTGGGNMSEQRAIHSVNAGVEQSPPIDEQRDDEADPRAAGYFSAGVAPAEDGYNWRKYGQKQVKGSESLQCYYKCTHSHCLVKKKVERSQEGHITEIIYKGAHNHPKPSPGHRSALGSSGAFNDTQLDNVEHAFTGADGDPVWTNVQRGNVASEWRHDNPEVTSSAMLGAEYSNGATCLHVHNSSQFESGDAADRSSTFSNGEDDDERGTHGSVSVPYDGEGDESETKKRKVEAYTADMSGATRAIKDPRVVVQTTSEVDILDDGYRWRKYGQKVVKGNPNPRSYYKCTSSGCSVRKHVERASHDLNSVITTYEGKHNHDVPAVRNSSHVNSGVSSNVPNAVQYRAEHSQHHNNMSSIHRSASFGSFGLPTGPHLIPPQDLGYGMNQRNMPNLALGGWGLNQGHQYIGQPRAMNEMELMLPKGEPKVEPMFDSGLSLPNASAVYQQALSRMPLGPHM